MFDDRTQEQIMNEMLEQFGADVRTDEGSLAYNACAKIGEKLEEIYGDMDDLNDNMLPTTQDDAHLIDYGSERGIEYTWATYPVVRGVFQQEIEIGERFTCNDYSYEVTALISGYEYELTCDTEGVEANTNFGELTPEDYVDDYLGGQITEVIVAGVDDEDIELYRQKVIETFQSTAFGGNRADYRKFINEINGVGGCKPKRRASDSPWINITVIGADYGVPASELVNTIQTLVDPEENSGEGVGMAPICHNVKILPVSSVDVNVETNVTFDTGFSAETSQSLIEAAVSDYLLELRESWEARDLEDTVVRVSQIEAKILSVEGVLDLANTTINGSAENLELDYTMIPLFGGVDIV